MKKNIFNKLVLSFVEVSALTLALTSCEPDAASELSGDKTAEGAGAPISVATVTADASAGITTGSVIGVSVGYDDSYGINRQYVIQADGSAQQESGLPVYMKSTGTLLFYYPFQGSENANPWIECNTTTQQNISPLYIGFSQECSNASASNLSVNLHDFYGKAKFDVVNVPLATGETITGITVNSLVMESTFNLVNRNFEDRNDVSWDLKNNNYEQSSVTGGTEYTLRLIPHTYSAADDVKVQVITSGGQEYNIPVGAFTISAGTATPTFTVDVATQKTSLSYGVDDPVTWTNADE